MAAAAQAAPPALDNPPISPDVEDQQSPVSQYIQNQQGEGGQAQGPGANAGALVEQKMNQVAGILKEVAQLLVNFKPHVMPVLQKGVQALSMVMNEVQTSKQQAQQGQPGIQRQPPPGSEQPGGVQGGLPTA